VQVQVLLADQNERLFILFYAIQSAAFIPCGLIVELYNF
jgi:hypothetical protein